MKNKLPQAAVFLLILMIPLKNVLSDEPSDQETMQTDWVKPFEYDLSLPYNSFREESGLWNTLWGRPFRDHLLLGMWTTHFQKGEDQENNNQLIALAYEGYYAGTFINTFRDRVWSAGWQRTLYQDRWGIFDVEAGYRAGVMYGYSQYLQLFGTKFYPLLQTMLDIDYKGFGVEFSWAGVVATAGFYYRF